MVIPRKWKLVAGTMSAAVALGTGTAVAHEDGDDDSQDGRPVLTEVVDIEELPQLDVGGDPPLVQVQDQVDGDSPFDSVADESMSLESEESIASEASPESDSMPSEESMTSDESTDSDRLHSEESMSISAESTD